MLFSARPLSVSYLPWFELVYGSVLCGSVLLQPAYFALIAISNIVAWFSPIDYRIDCSWKSWCNKLGIFDWIFRLLFSVAFTFLQGWTWSLSRSVYLKRLFFGSKVDCQFIQGSIPTCELPGRLALPYHRVGRVSQYAMQLLRVLVPQLTFSERASVLC